MKFEIVYALYWGFRTETRLHVIPCESKEQVEQWVRTIVRLENSDSYLILEIKEC